jgi:hypothetical protein
MYLIDSWQNFLVRQSVRIQWHTLNWINLPYFKTNLEEIRPYSSQYIARLSTHPHDLIVNLIELPDNRRLRKHLPNDLPTTFLV